MKEFFTIFGLTNKKTGFIFTSSFLFVDIVLGSLKINNIGRKTSVINSSQKVLDFSADFFTIEEVQELVLTYSKFPFLSSLVSSVAKSKIYLSTLLYLRYLYISQLVK